MWATPKDVKRLKKNLEVIFMKEGLIAFKMSLGSSYA